MSGTELSPAARLDPLHAELRDLIAASRQRLAGAVNAELTRLYWLVGQRLSAEVLGGERPAYGTQLISQLGAQLAQEFGRGFEARNLRRMVKFAQAFPAPEIVSTLSTKLSWSHLVAIVALKTTPAQQFYASQAAQEGWSVRELAKQIERKAFERNAIASAQAPVPQAADAAPTLIFKDPSQGRHHRRRILDRIAAQGGAGAKTARGAAGSARAAGAARGVVGGE